MLKKLTTLVIFLMLSCLAAASAGQPNSTDTVFNKKFVYRMKPRMPFELLAKIIGTKGKTLAEVKDSQAPIGYHWDGGRKSALDAKVVAGKVVEVTVTTPKGKKYSLGKNGELVELGD